MHASERHQASTLAGQALRNRHARFALGVMLEVRRAITLCTLEQALDLLCLTEPEFAHEQSAVA
jgi:hypothetical protein